MVSDKQMEYIGKLAKWKGVSLDAGKVSAMDDTEASGFIDSLKAMKSVANGDGEESSVPRASAKPQKKLTDAWNPIQAGMAKKAVASTHNTEWVVENPKAFAKEVLGVYHAFEEADKLIRFLEAS